MEKPLTKRAVAFFDGQNLYHAAKEAFGYTYPNYDVYALANAICSSKDWALSQVRFYTGMPDKFDDDFWHEFWTRKLAVMGRQGVHLFNRSLRYRNHKITLPDGSQHTFLVGEEKGIDVRIAIDIIRLAHAKAYDVALVFSQDQDLSEVAKEIRIISQEQNRWICISSAFPFSPTVKNKRGIDKTNWIRIEKKVYDACLDKRDYRINLNV